jgi:hypothetical protein
MKEAGRSQQVAELPNYLTTAGPLQFSLWHFLEAEHKYKSQSTRYHTNEYGKYSRATVPYVQADFRYSDGTELAVQVLSAPYISHVLYLTELSSSLIVLKNRRLSSNRPRSLWRRHTK